MQRMTDRIAIKMALGDAILYAESVIEAYRGEFGGKPDETEPAVIHARRNIAAWRRVLSRYYADPRTASDLLDEALAKCGTVSIMDLMRGSVPDRDHPEDQSET